LATSRTSLALTALVLAQAAHSAEEYFGRLWESLPPVRFVAGVISADLERGFVIANLVIVAFGLWCVLWPVRRRWSAAAALTWLWVVVEALNGTGHVLWALGTLSYRPGLFTAPLLLLSAFNLGRQLHRARNEARTAA
jgi:hypothetical protein